MLEIILQKYEHLPIYHKIFHKIKKEFLTKLSIFSWEYPKSLIENYIELYFWLYSVPLINEIVIRHTNVENYYRIIYSHFCFMLLARFNDNLLDEDINVFSKNESLILSNHTFYEAYSSFNKTNIKWQKEHTEIFVELYNYEDYLANTRSISLEKLYNRVSFAMIVPFALFNETSFLEIYKNYINYMLLNHDLFDVFDDVKKGQRTYITDIMNINRDFSTQRIVVLFNDVRKLLNNIADEIINKQSENIFFKEVFPEIHKSITSKIVI